MKKMQFFILQYNEALPFQKQSTESRMLFIVNDVKQIIWLFYIYFILLLITFTLFSSIKNTG